MKNKEASHIIVDWGTTNFRAFLVDKDGKLINKTTQHMGLLQVKNQDFANELEGIFRDWLNDYHHLPVFMAGMVGSAVGWVNVDYAHAPANNNDVKDNAHRFKLPWGSDGTIFPGVSVKTSNKFDVMRGEEVQIFGLNTLLEDDTFFAILPGTHSKHVHFNNEKITDFSTFMTGELFNLLSEKSMLSKGLCDIHVNSEFNTSAKLAFKAGIEAAQDSKFSTFIFQAWSQRLAKQLEPKDTLDFLSGMLIGYELSSIKQNTAFIVGGNALRERYSYACEYFGIKVAPYDGDKCFLLGMQQLITQSNQKSNCLTNQEKVY